MWQWLFDPLTETQITQIGTTKFPTDQMTACTIKKDFKEQFEPKKPFVYEELPMIERKL